MNTELVPGTRVAGYRIEALIGRGAMAEVYRARDEEERAVALKLLDAASAHDERFRRRFLRESDLAASLHHPHIVRTLESGEDAGRLYLAMEYVEGNDLRKLLHDEGRIDPERAVALLEQVADALDAAHDAGLVHRDVKPGNILVRDDHAYVCDFGLARHISSVSSLTGDRGFVGTIDYVSPEQIEGTAVDGRTDVYSLGCVLYECLTGIRPYERESELSVVFAHLNEPPPKLTDMRADLPAAFDDVFATALAKSPDDRYASCGELALAARAALRGEVLARRQPRRTLLVTASGVVLTAAIVAVVLGTTGGSRASPVTITPASIAGAKLGDTDLTLRRLWGRVFGEATLDQPQNYSMLTYRGRGLTAFFVGSSIDTVEITTANSSDRTAEGIGPCSSLAALKKAYGSRLKPNPHMVDPQNKATVYGWTLGKHLLFIMGPAASTNAAVKASTVEAVALYGNDLASAGYVAPSECVPGTANVVTRPAVATQAAAGPALTRTLTAKRFTPRLTLRVPPGWTSSADTIGVFRVDAPGARTSIEFRLDPSAASGRGIALTNVSGSVNGLSNWLRSTAAFHTNAPRGSHAGRPVLTLSSIDLGSAAHGRSYLLFRSHGASAVWSTGAVGMRLYLTSIRIGTVVHTLAIVVRAGSPHELARALPTADAILRSIHVRAVPTREITALSAQCTQPFGGTCIGEVTAGTHTSRTFKPSLTYTLPVGWTNFNDSPGNFGLVPPGGDWNSVVNGDPTDYVGVFQRIAPTGSRCGDDAGAVRSASAYVRWLQAKPGLSITGLRRVTISGLSGFVLDLRIRRSWKETCPWSRGQPAVQLIHGVPPSYEQMIHQAWPQPFVMRLYLLDYEHATFGIEIDDFTGKQKLQAYDAVVRTFRFKTN
jgi:tRNA A-37 threonylcarbamoyl transferase component Bud32